MDRTLKNMIGRGTVLERPGERVFSGLIDATFAVLLLATPVLAIGFGREAAALLVIIGAGGALVLYQKGSRARRLSRCCWLLFLAVATSIYFATGSPDQSDSESRLRAMTVPWVELAVGAGFVSWALKLAAGRHLPRLGNAYDWGAALTVVVLAIPAGTLAALGYPNAAFALVVPIAIIGMHFIVRERFRSLRRARLFVQFAIVSALAALLTWFVSS